MTNLANNRDFLRGTLYKTYGCIFQNKLNLEGAKKKKENYEKGLQYFNKAEKHLNKSVSEDNSIIGYLYADIAALHQFAGEICKQKEYLDKSVAVLEKCVSESNSYFRGIKATQIQATIQCMAKQYSYKK